MPYELSWFVENRVAKMRIWNELNGEELETSALRLSEDYLNQGIAPVHVVIDNLEMTKFPANLVAMRKAVQPLMTNPALGWLITIGEQNKLVQFVTSMTAHIIGVQSRTVPAEDDIIPLLRRVDSSIEVET